MSWFGGGSKDSDSGAGEKSFASADSSVLASGGGDSLGADLGGGGANAAMAEFQQASMALQQQLLVQTVITDLTDRAFVKCVTAGSKDSKLTSREVSCIQACTNKWLDANDFLARRLNKKGEQMLQQQQAQGGGF